MVFNCHTVGKAYLIFVIFSTGKNFGNIFLHTKVRKSRQNKMEGWAALTQLHMTDFLQITEFKCLPLTKFIPMIEFLHVTSKSLYS